MLKTGGEVTLIFPISILMTKVRPIAAIDTIIIEGTQNNLYAQVVWV